MAVLAPEFLPWLLLALAGMIFQQSAFRAGALTASLPTMTVAKPVVAGSLGIFVLGETLNAPGPAEAFVLVAAVVVVIVATVALARGEAATMSRRTGRDAKAPLPDSGARSEDVARPDPCSGVPSGPDRRPVGLAASTGRR